MYIHTQTTLSGPASVPPMTVCEAFKRVTKKYSFKPALRVKRNNEWATWTFKDYYDDVTKATKSMIKLGVERFHGVCILGFNSPEWFISYLAGIMVSWPLPHSQTPPVLQTLQTSVSMTSTRELSSDITL